MANKCARFNDLCTGHGCWPPRVNDQGSENTFVNNRKVHRQTDHWVIHCCPPPCHDSQLASGSSTVYVNNLQCGRIGDPVACGSKVMTGSDNVIVGP